MLSLLPGAIIWMFHSRIIAIRSKFFRYLTVPMIYVTGMTIGLSVLMTIGNFDMDAAIAGAIEKQNDMKQGYYGGSSFDIGETDASLTGIIRKAPAAIVAGIYRPFLYEARNVVVLLAGAENLLYLYLSVMILVRLRLRRLLKVIFETPILLFCLSYAILFSFIVGLSTSNFGALVRFKIPYLPFLLTALFVLDYIAKRKLVK